MKKYLFSFLFSLILGGNLVAGGFQLNEHGAKAMAMGGAFAGLANDLSAFYFNPAGLAFMNGINVSAGTALIAPTGSFRGPSPSIQESKMVNKLFTPSHLYFSYQVDDKLVLGFGANNPFGLGTTWDDNWVGRFAAVVTEVQVFSFNAVAAYKLLDNLSLSAGFQYNFANVEITKQQNLSPFNGEAHVDLKGKDMAAFGFTIGALWKPTLDFSIGATYRSQVKYDFEGDVVTTGPAQLSAALPNAPIAAELTTPAQVIAGIAYKFMPNFVVTADFQYVMWSSYDYLTVTYKSDGKVLTSSERLFEDTWIARLGIEYKYNSSLALRAGFLYDRNPVKDEYLDPTLPDANRLGFSGGIGYALTNNLSLDLAYLFLRFQERTITNSKISTSGTVGFSPMNGTYNSYANLFSLTFNYKF
ncbi:MAG: outer membrane protein transport protein [Ignavibacteriales bacterium]|nr:outer membrane protein transport protein [Ignavibacteriales bacterium]